ncbi:transmembrane protein [Arabidopsis thaliana]|uniref:Transmembrane protein n=1 Tax=Arabidopsis thaliana TaxID=3702 RepID=Q8GXM1_ARATH|nr:uncharacterized protein AT2G16586 [Arabidopsis thaliana]AEC06513.1 transmembrane protein [Arabidopsis thaliana]BAC42786.1 unknown protein [Arabidopsis thaliana]|eukprot:NP_001031357.1 transmembrane protein [Arabidopsis thaliana]
MNAMLLFTSICISILHSLAFYKWHMPNYLINLIYWLCNCTPMVCDIYSYGARS